MKKEQLTKILTYSGSIPFLFLTYLGFSKATHFFTIDVSLICRFLTRCLHFNNTY